MGWRGRLWVQDTLGECNLPVNGGKKHKENQGSKEYLLTRHNGNKLQFMSIKMGLLSLPLN